MTISSKSISESAAWFAVPGAWPPKASAFGTRSTPAGIASNDGRWIFSSSVSSRKSAAANCSFAARRSVTGSPPTNAFVIVKRRSPAGHAAGEEVELDPERQHRLAHAELAERMHEHVAEPGRLRKLTSCLAPPAAAARSSCAGPAARR